MIVLEAYCERDCMKARGMISWLTLLYSLHSLFESSYLTSLTLVDANHYTHFTALTSLI